MNAPGRRRVRPSSSSTQTDLFALPSGLPEGFRYHPGILSPEEEQALARELASLPFKPFDFHGYLANRQVVSFGYRYDYDRRAVVEVGAVSVVSRVLETEDRGDVRPPGRRFPSGPHQRISARRRDRLASGQGAVRRGRRRLAACALRLALSAEGGRHLGPSVASGRAALGLSPIGASPRGVGAQHSGPRPPSLLNHLADACCEGDKPAPLPITSSWPFSYAAAALPASVAPATSLRRPVFTS